MTETRAKPCGHCGGPIMPRHPANAKRQKYCGVPCYKAAQRAVPDSERFWSKVQKGEGCWLWMGAKQRAGYGHFVNRDRQHLSAHRWSWEQVHGPITKAQHVLHRCDVRHCVNPAHLWIGTHEQNMADMAAKGRQIRGERNRHAKLTESQAREILRHKPAKRTYGLAPSLASKYGIGIGVVFGIWAGRLWKHIQEGA